MPSNPRFHASIVICAALLAPVCEAKKPKPAPPPPAPIAAPAPERVTTVEGITEYRLANGLRVLLFPDQSKPTITVNITYLVGSRHENYGETGMAHLLEHLVFKGTPRHADIPQELTGAWRAPQRHHLAATAPTTSRPSRPPTRTCAGRSTSKPTAWSIPSSPRRISTAR